MLIRFVFTNVIILFGSTIGWIVAQIYLITLGTVGEDLIPDIIFSFRDVPPLGLPFVSQLNAAIICMMVVCSISWLLTVIALRSWRKATSVSVLSVCLAYLPLLSPSIDAFITTFLPIFEQVPKVILLLAVPAIQGLVMTEVDEITEMEHEAAVCSGCQAIASSVDAQFCGFCGATLAFASTDRRDSVEKGS